MVMSDQRAASEKFAQLINGKYGDYLKVIDDCKGICYYFINGFSKHPEKEPIIETAIRVQRLTLEYIDSILCILRQGFITQAIVLLRSLFELSNLYTYVYMDHEHYKKWQKEKKIKPNIIRRTLKKQGFDPGQKTYGDLSKFTHANYEFLSEHEALNALSPVNDMQKLMIPHCMIDMMRFLMRISLVSCKIYGEHVEKAEDIIQMKNEELGHLRENVLQLDEKQARSEEEYAEFKKLLQRIKTRHFEE